MTIAYFRRKLANSYPSLIPVRTSKSKLCKHFSHDLTDLKHESNTAQTSSFTEHHFSARNRAFCILTCQHHSLARFCPNKFQYTPYHPLKLSQALDTSCNIHIQVCHFHFSVLQVDFHSSIQLDSKQAKCWRRFLGPQASCTSPQTPLKLAILLCSSQAETGKM